MLGHIVQLFFLLRMHNRKFFENLTLLEFQFHLVLIITIFFIVYPIFQQTIIFSDSLNKLFDHHSFFYFLLPFYFQLLLFFAYLLAVSLQKYVNGELKVFAARKFLILPTQFGVLSFLLFLYDGILKMALLSFNIQTCLL